MDNYKNPKKEYITNQLPYYSPYFYNPGFVKNNKYYVNKKKYILPKNEWTSLFIPIIDSSYTKDYLKHIIENKYSIGSVERIDLIKLRETDYSHSDDYSVFIHFFHWYYNPFTVYLRKHLEQHKSYHIKYYYRNFEPNMTNIPIDYFILMKNRSDVYLKSNRESPIQINESGPKRKNSNQSINSENSSFMNDALFKQQKRIELLEDELDALRKLFNHNP